MAKVRQARGAKDLQEVRVRKQRRKTEASNERLGRKIGVSPGERLRKDLHRDRHHLPSLQPQWNLQRLLPRKARKTGVATS